MSKALDKKAKVAILDQMESLGEVTTENGIELIRPHYIFDSLAARERELRRKAHHIMAQFRDDQGIRSCYNFMDNGQSKYVNVDKTDNVVALNGVDAQLRNKYIGLREARKKINARLLELAGQLAMFGEED